MKVVELRGVRQCGIVERSQPKAKGSFAVVRLEVIPMCTEFKGYKGGWVTDCLGHEAAGTVVDIDGIREVEVGDRVVVMPQYPCGRCRLCLAGEYVYCQNSLDPHAVSGNSCGSATYAQFMIKQDRLLAKIPSGLSTELASMANCGIGPSFGGARRIGLSGEDTVLITGLGPVGLGAVIVAKWFGARVIAVDSNAFRKSLAGDLGADHIFDAADPDLLSQIKSVTSGIGVDKVLECSGAPTAQRLAIDALRRLGSMAFVGEAGELTLHVSNDLIRKGITLHGSWYYNLADVPLVLRLIQDRSDLVAKMITHRFPMSQVEEAWQLQLTGNCGKVLLDPWS